MNQEALIHLIKTILYRYFIATGHADQHYGEFEIGKGVKCPNAIIHHMRDLVLESLQICKTGKWDTQQAPVGDFETENKLFLTSTLSLLEYSEKSPISEPTQKKLIQGPLSDALNHIGQLSMISRLQDKHVSGQNYSRVDLDEFLERLRS